MSTSKSTSFSEAFKPRISQNKKIDKRNVECFFCHKKGHFKSECRKLLAKSANKGPGSNHQAFSAEMKNLTAVGHEDVWLADSAASKHMTSHKDWFSTFEEIPDKSISIQIGDNSFVYAAGIGSIAVMASLNGKLEPCTLENTLYVPNLKKNLFSVGAATSKNLKVMFDSKTIKIFNTTKLVATGTILANQCYKMSFKTSRVEQANVTSSSSA